MRNSLHSPSKYLSEHNPRSVRDLRRHRAHRPVPRQPLRVSAPDRASARDHVPISHADIVATFRAKVCALKAAHPGTRFDILPIGTGLEGKHNRIVAIIDAIVSNPGVAMPWKEFVEVCREEGVWSVIGAAHSLEQEVCISLEDVEPDFWVSKSSLQPRATTHKHAQSCTIVRVRALWYPIVQNCARV